MLKRVYLVFGLLFLLIQAAPAAAQGPVGPAHTDPGWQATYWNNPTLSGPPALQRTDTRLDFDWGHGSPDPVINADRFSARWTRYIDVSPGNYRFSVTTDDGIRLWVDNNLVIDQWRDQGPTTYTAEVYLGSGHHLLKIEYYENVGGAVARVSWTQAGPSTGGWRGEYYNNTSLSGYPALVRDDSRIDFNWGNGSPAPGQVNADGFSVRWSRSLNLSPGNHRFTLTTDDGARLFVNGHLLIDAWRNQGPTTYHGEIYLPGGPVSVQMEYYENTGGAVARLSWDTPGEPPPPPPPTTAVGYVVSWRLHIRSGPGLHYGIVGWSHRHDSLTLFGRTSDSSWLKVKTRHGLDGWASARFIYSNTPITNLPVLDDPSPPPPATPTGYVTAYRLNLRAGPSAYYGVKGWLYRGQPVVLLGRNGTSTWLRVKTQSGYDGWVSARYINSSVPIYTLPVVG